MFRQVKATIPGLLSNLWFLIGLLALIPSGTLLSQSAQAFVKVDSVTIGERFDLYVVAAYELGSQTRPPQTESGTLPFGEIELIELKRKLTAGARDSNARVDTMIYEAAAFGIDSVQVTSIPIRIISASGDTTRTHTQAFFIPVRSIVPEDAAGIYDLAPLAEFPREWWPWVLGFLLLVVLAWLIWRYIKKRRMLAEAEDLPPAPRTPPYEEAVKRLRKLSEMPLGNEASTKLFYIELSDLIRTYYARTLHIPAMEQTTRELMADLKAKSEPPHVLVTEEALQKTRNVLSEADLVKFADYRTTDAQHKTSIKHTEDLLKRVEQAIRQRMMMMQSAPENSIPQEV
jgi:hypothetical protein